MSDALNDMMRRDTPNKVHTQALSTKFIHKDNKDLFLVLEDEDVRIEDMGSSFYLNLEETRQLMELLDGLKDHLGWI